MDGGVSAGGSHTTEERGGHLLPDDAPGGDRPVLDLTDDAVVLDLTDDAVVLDLTDATLAREGGPVVDVADGPPVGAVPALDGPAETARPPRRVPPALSAVVLVAGSVWLIALGAWPAALVVLAVLASVAGHELAHLGAARAVGVRSEEFFVGFGPRLWSTHRGGTEWGVKLVPAGGYVRLVDEEGAAPWRKAVIAVAGPAANLGLALVLMVVVALAGNLPTLTGSTADLPLVERAGVGAERFADAAVASVEPVVELPGTIVSMGRAAVSGDDVPDDADRLVSPVGIGRLADQASGEGWAMAVLLVAVVNLALGLFNLVPLPPLDGGRIVVAGAEAVAGRLRGRRVVLTGKGFERVGIAVVGVLLLAGLSALVLDVVHPLANPFGG